MKIAELQRLLVKDPQELKQKFGEVRVDYDEFMMQYTGESHKIGFIKFFIEELNKINSTLTYSTRKKILRKVFDLRQSRLLIYLSDYDLKEFFDHKEFLVSNIEERINKRFMLYNSNTIQTMAVADDKKKRTINSVQNKVFDNLNLVLDTQRHIIVYLKEKLIPLLNYNLTLLTKTPNRLASELSIFERGEYQRNEQEINIILKQLKSYIDPAAVTKYANILGVPFQVFGEEDASDLTPTVLMDTIYKVLAEKEETTEKYINKLSNDLPNVVDSLEETIKVPTMEELLKKEELGDAEPIEIDKATIKAENVTKLKGHRSLFDGSAYVPDDDETYTDYEIEEITEENTKAEKKKESKKLELPEKDFLKQEKSDEGHDDVLY